MSAITGILQLNDQPIEIEHGMGIMKKLQEYPSDDIQTWCNKQVFLGCHSQWITPESVGEILPYFDYDRQLAITADAIIDNRQELFDKLQIKKEKGRTISDSQLILLAYCKWGEEVTLQLTGDFAFMIWDEKKRKLFGARDFSGSRTLYFYRDLSRFAFSTTIEPLLTLPYIKKDLNQEWLAEFIAIPGMVDSVDTKSTVYKYIEQLPPSHTITVSDRKVKFSRYRKIELDKKIRLKSDGEYEEAFRDVIQTAVAARVRTYGKVGTRLSGGLDSGTITSFAAKELNKQNKKLYSYSYVPEDDFLDWTPKYYTVNESPYIKETVNYVGNISDQYLDFKGKGPLSELDEMLDVMEMPYKFFENAFWLKGISEEANKDGIKILLNGARGNHSISFGSSSLTNEYYTSLLKRLRLFRLYRELGLYCHNYSTGKTVMFPILIKKAFPIFVQMFIKTNSIKSRNPAPLLNPLMAKKTNVFEKLQEYGMNTSERTKLNAIGLRRSHFEQLYTWNNSGTATTKLSLRYSLWERDPTNDIRVIQFCISVPDEQYVNGGMERSLIRRATKNILPDKVRLNHQSRGLQAAEVITRMSGSWDMFINEIEQLIRDPKTSDLLNIEVIKEIVSKVTNPPRPEFAFNEEFTLLTRSLMIYRFLKKCS